MTFEDREGGVWIKAECPRLVPKSTRLVATCSSRGIWREVAIHFPGLKGLDKLIVWVFPKVFACFECDHTIFRVPERELKVLQTGLPVEGAVVWQPDDETRSYN
jgi:hypothetical protein